MRWGNRLVAVVVAGAAMAAGVATPVVAGGAEAPAAVSSPLRVEKSSGHNGGALKEAVATCPDGRVVSAGAEVVDGKGAVVLTAIEPDPDLTSVTAVAAARDGVVGDWSVVAIAICHPDGAPMGRVVGRPDGRATASASCPDDTQLSGVGFRMLGPVDATRLVALEPSADLRQVQVRTAGPVAPVGLLAYGICQDGSQWERGEAAGRIDGVWPKVVEVSVPSWCPEVVYGVGGAVDASGGFLTALVPDPVRNRAWVRAERAVAATRATAAPAAAAAGEEEEARVYSIEIGTPYC